MFFHPLWREFFENRNKLLWSFVVYFFRLLLRSIICDHDLIHSSLFHESLVTSDSHVLQKIHLSAQQTIRNLVTKIQFIPTLINIYTLSMTLRIDPSIVLLSFCINRIYQSKVLFLKNDRNPLFRYFLVIFWCLFIKFTLLIFLWCKRKILFSSLVF